MEIAGTASLMSTVLVLWAVIAALMAFPGPAAARIEHHHHHSKEAASVAASSTRAYSVSVTQFGAVGDGITSNTKAFANAMAFAANYASSGGTMVVVPPGRYLTGPFNITCNHFTLFLEQDAVVLAAQDISEWPIIAPLPSYGRGRDLPGPRYSNFIMGTNLTDVIITGNNGTIDGQGRVWWDKFHNDELNYTRGYLLEVMFSDQIVISNLTFVDSPAWNIHPVYSRNVTVSGITVLAPIDSPNTDGINPDSSSDVLIEDCFVVSGDDCVAIKSGWDEYGIAFGMPSQHIVIRRLTCVSPTSAVIAMGSEMSGGIQDVRAEDITAINSESGIRIKTSLGRGGFVRNVHVKRMNLYTIKWVFWMTGNYGAHPDDKVNLAAVPVIDDINYRDVYAENVTMVARLEGIPRHPFTGICISNVTAHVVDPKQLQWNCTDIAGVSGHVSPAPCAALRNEDGMSCPFPED